MIIFRVLITEIPNNKNLVRCLKDRTQIWLETNSERNWQNKVASDKKLLYPYSSFSDALQAYLHIIVRKQIAKLLCAIEKLSATRTLFLIYRPQKMEEVEQTHKLLEFWIECFMDPKLVNTKEIPEPKPDIHIFEQWQHDVTKVSSLVAKVLKGQSLPIFQILCICNDFMSTIPLSNLEEIITHGKNSNEQEILSTEFINRVLDVLYQMEPTEENLVPRRSFILKCLGIIKLE